MTVREYIYGLPRFLDGKLLHGIQLIRYRMLKRMDSFNLSSNLWDSVNQNHIQGLALSYVIHIENKFEL